MPSISNIKGDQIVTSSLGVGHQPNFVFSNDGHNTIDLSGSLILRGSGSVPTGPNGAGVIYYDPSDQKIKAVENGGVASNLVGGISSTDAQNDGVGQGLYKGNLDSNTLRFRSVIAGVDIGILSGSDEITISYTGTMSADGVNVGGGQGTYNGNTDSNTLSFRSLLPGTNMGFVSGAQTLMISYTGSVGADGVNLGVGQSVYNGNTDSDTLSFRSILAGPQIQIVSGTNEITISYTGSVGADGVNVGGGQRVYNDNQDINTLKFRSLIAGAGIGLASGSTEITIAYTGSAISSADGVNVGGGQGVYNDNQDSNTLKFRSLIAGSGIGIVSGSNEITLSYTGSAITSADGVNVGGGQGVYNDNQDSNTLRFRSLIAGAGIGLASGSNEITVSYTGSAISSADGVNVGGGQGTYNGNSDSNTLTFRSLLPGTNMGFVSGAQTLMISYTGSVGADGANLGVGQGTYNGNSDNNTLTFRSILAGPQIQIVSGTNEITISYTGSVGADGVNLGVGQGTYNGNTDSNTLSFRSLLAGTGMGFVSGSETIMISYTGSAGGGADAQNDGVGQGLYKGNLDTDTLRFRSIIAGTDIGIVSGSNEITISYTGSNALTTVNPATGRIVVFSGSTALSGSPTFTAGFGEVVGGYSANFFAVGTSFIQYPVELHTNVNGYSRILNVVNDSVGTESRTLANFGMTSGSSAGYQFEHRYTSGETLWHNPTSTTVFHSSQSIVLSTNTDYPTLGGDQFAGYTTNRIRVNTTEVLINEHGSNYNFVYHGSDYVETTEVNDNLIYGHALNGAVGFGTIPNNGSRVVVSGGLQIMATSSLTPTLSEANTFKLIYDPFTGKARISENAGAYQDLLGVGGGADGVNVGGGQGVYNGNSDSNTLTFRSLLAGTGMGFVSGSETLMISFTGSAGGIDGTGAQNQIPYFLDTDTVQASANFTFDGGELRVTGSSMFTDTLELKTNLSVTGTLENRRANIGQLNITGSTSDGTLLSMRTDTIPPGASSQYVSIGGSGTGYFSITTDNFTGGRSVTLTAIPLILNGATSTLTVNENVRLSGSTGISGSLVFKTPQTDPSISQASEAKLYYDNTDQKLKISENGGAYQSVVQAATFTRTSNVIYPSVNTIYVNWRAPYACSASYFSGYILSGTRARVNVYKNSSATPLFPTGTVIASVQSWAQNPSVHGENGSFAAGDSLIFQIMELTGTVGQINMQLTMVKS